MTKSRKTVGGRPSDDILLLVGELVAEIDRINAGTEPTGRLDIRSVKIRCGYPYRTDTLVILAGWDEDDAPAVAFHSADTVVSAVRGCLSRYVEGSLDWREDGFYQG